MSQKLNQVLAVERNTKSKANSELTKLHRASNTDLFNGFSRKYNTQEEGGETFPAEQKLVQFKAEETLKKIERTLSGLFDITATKDAANQSAVATVIVAGEELLTGVPATTLLFLEKQLHDLNTFVGKMPILDPQFTWKKDEAVNLFKADSQKTTKTKKVHKPIVLHPATKEHPAQTQLVQEDVIVGHWTKELHSGAFTEERRRSVTDRIETLQKAVKYAREAANNVKAPDVFIGEKVFGYLFS